MDKKYDKVLSQCRYEYYKKNRVNESTAADMILAKIKNGYDPNEADVFELMCDDDSKINQYRKYYNIKKQIENDEKISESDLMFLIEQLNLNSSESNELIKQFKKKGLVI